MTYREKKEFETIDDEIEILEQKLAAIDAEMLKHATESGKLNELVKEKEMLEAELETKTQRWVYLNELAEQIAQQ